MNDEQKRLLVEANPYTIEGVECHVAGWRNEEASVTPATGRNFTASWQAIQRAFDNGKVLSAADVRWIGNLWYGYEESEPEALTLRVPQSWR